MLDHESLRFVFGLKLRHLRRNKGLSPKDLAVASGLSVSYINEIEKGKKYPKTAKIVELAKALGVSYDHLISSSLDKELDGFSEVVKNNMMKGIPFDFLGIPTNTVFEIFGGSPDKLKALLGAFFELQRSYNISVEELFSAVLRSFVDQQKYFFPELEKAAEELRAEIDQTSPDADLAKLLPKLLQKRFSYQIHELDFQEFSPNLRQLQFIHYQQKSPLLMINHLLSTSWKNYLYAKEIGYSYLNLQERVSVSYPVEVDSFEKLFNHFKAAYFAGALLIPRDFLKKELKKFLAHENWQPGRFKELLNSFKLPARVVLHRVIQVLPSGFDVSRIFLLEISAKNGQQFNLSRQLHLTERHAPYRLHSKEHYCRRWVALNIHQTLHDSSDALATAIQISYYPESDREYLCFSAAFHTEPQSDETTSVTIGFLLDDVVKKHFKFWNDPVITRRKVGHSCERCTIKNCNERAAEAIVAEKSEADIQIKKDTLRLIEKKREEGKRG